MKPTGPQAIISAVVLGVAAGWLLFGGLEAFGFAPPRIPLVAAISIYVLAAVIAVQAWFTHQAIQRRREWIEPRRAVTLLVLGKTCVLTGAAFTGAYAAVVVQFIGRLDAALPRERVVSSAVAVLGSVALAVAGAFLERACRIPDPPNGDATPKQKPGTPESSD